MVSLSQYLHVKPKQTEAITRGIAITNTLSKLFRVTLGKRIETSWNGKK